MSSIYWSNNLLGASCRPRLLHDFLLVKIEETTHFAGGLLHAPEILAPTNVWVGRVHGIGEGYKTPKGVRLPSNVKVGDRVVFDAVASWTSITIDDVKYVMVRELDVFGVLAEDVVLEVGIVRANLSEAPSSGVHAGPTGFGGADASGGGVNVAKDKP